MKAELVPEGGGPSIPITRDVTVVGRREYCDVRLDHPSLSKRHAILVKTDGLLILRDLASTNGTKVKGQRIRWAALLPEDRVSFGTLKFRVYLGPDDQPGPSERPGRLAATNGGPGRAPAGFAAPSIRGPTTAVAPGLATQGWDHGPDRPGPSVPVRLNDHELLIEDDEDEVVELEDDAVVDLGDGVIELK